MVEFRRANGARMWVADDRVEEYKAAGFKLAADLQPEKPAPVPEAKAEKEVKPEAKKDPVKKTTKKRK